MKSLIAMTALSFLVAVPIALPAPQQVYCRDYFIANCLDCPGQSSYHCRLSANGPFYSCVPAAPTSCEEGPGLCDQVQLGATGCS